MSRTVLGTRCCYASTMEACQSHVETSEVFKQFPLCPLHLRIYREWKVSLVGGSSIDSEISKETLQQIVKGIEQGSADILPGYAPIVGKSFTVEFDKEGKGRLRE